MHSFKEAVEFFTTTITSITTTTITTITTTITTTTTTIVVDLIIGLIDRHSFNEAVEYRNLIAKVRASEEVPVILVANKVRLC